jgi:hypothetical protein
MGKNKNQPPPQPEQEECKHSWSNWSERYVSDSHVVFVRQCTKCWEEEVKG